MVLFCMSYKFLHIPQTREKKWLSLTLPIVDLPYFLPCHETDFVAVGFTFMD